MTALITGAGAAVAQGANAFRDAAGVELDQYRWEARPVLVFGASPDAPDYVRQMEALRAAGSGLIERDILVFSDTGISDEGALRGRFAPEDFLVVLIGKDGGVKLSHTSPISTETLFRTIDAMPMRQREMREE